MRTSSPAAGRASGVDGLQPRAATTMLARVLASQQLLLVLDNCEHVISAAAPLCAGLLAACDDVRVLATSREPLAVAGEARYRLVPLSLPDPGDQTGPGGSEAVALFADRARRADARFTLDDREQRVFRWLPVFPGPFTQEAAEAVAGTGAAPAVLHLVDCSLLSPPQEGLDGRSRYQMLETLRAYGSGLLAGAGEHDRAAAVLAGYTVRVAEQAAVGLQTNTAEEAEAARWLDAEDATMRQVLAWTMDHDPATAVRLAAALGWWWLLRGRLRAQYGLLGEIAGPDPGQDRLPPPRRPDPPGPGRRPGLASPPRPRGCG